MSDYFSKIRGSMPPEMVARMPPPEVLMRMMGPPPGHMGLNGPRPMGPVMIRPPNGPVPLRHPPPETMGLGGFMGPPIELMNPLISSQSNGEQIENANGDQEDPVKEERQKAILLLQSGVYLNYIL